MTANHCSKFAWLVLVATSTPATFSQVSRVTARKMVMISLACIGLAFGIAFRANATPVVLTFEGMGDRANVNGFYNGGTDSQGNSGTNYGVDFIGQDQAVIDASWSPPSPVTFWMLNGGWGGDIMNAPVGFDSFSFFYQTSSGTPMASVIVYDGLNATGNILATVLLPYNVSSWSFIDTGFSGTAYSVAFDAGQAQFFLDDLTLNFATPGDGGGTPVPEPGALGMIISGLALLAILYRRRRLS